MMKYLSVYSTDKEILKALSDIHLKGKWYEVDITYSKGIFWNGLKQPLKKSDLVPLFEDVIEADSQELNYLENNSVASIVFDPPFLFRNRKSKNNDKMCARFSYFKSYGELLSMYKNTLIACSNKLMKNGYLFFKCQDMTDGKFYCTHNDIINIALESGFILKDIAIKTTNNKLQKDAKQQNCVAKVHSYWLVFKKKDGNNEKSN